MQNVANAQKEIDGWMKLCKPEWFEDPDLHADNFVFKKFWECKEQLAKSKSVLEQHMKNTTELTNSDNQYQKNFLRKFFPKIFSKF